MNIRFRKIITASFVTAALVCVSQSAMSATWNITDVLAGAPGSGFGASLFHNSNGPNPTTASVHFDNFTGWAVTGGMWNDVTGALSASFSNGSMTTPKSFDIVSQEGFLFGAGGLMDDVADPNAGNINGFASFQLQNVMGLNAAVVENTIMTFLDGVQCCGGTPGEDPNTFLEQAGNIGFMTLWGASNYDGTANGNLDNFVDDVTGQTNPSRIGVDIRLRLSKVTELPPPIPIPAALPLFAGGLALLGLLGWRRRSAGAAA